jgi:hypothetical protein
MSKQLYTCDKSSNDAYYDVLLTETTNTGSSCNSLKRRGSIIVGKGACVCSGGRGTMSEYTDITRHFSQEFFKVTTKKNVFS